MSKDRIEMLAASYEGTMKATLEAAGKLPAEKRMKQLQDGKAHPLWLMGHLAFAFDVITNTIALGGTPVLPGNYFQKFAPDFVGGEAVTGNADDYPAWDEVVANYEKAGRAVIAKLRELEDADLSGGPKGSPPPGNEDFFKVLGVMLGGMPLHDSYHRGQMNMVAALD